MSTAKYEFTGVTKEIYGGTLKQIRAIRDLTHVKKGKIGGWIEKESNLSHDGDAWASDHAQIFGNARVYGNAWVSGKVRVADNTQISGDARVYGVSQIYGNAWVYGNAQIFGNARVYGHAQISGDAQIFGNARVYGVSRISGDARVYDTAQIAGFARVHNSSDICWFSNVKNRADALTIYKTKDGGVECKHGCFRGSLENFIDVINTQHSNDVFGQKYHILIQYIKLHLGIDGGTDSLKTIE